MRRWELFHLSLPVAVGDAVAYRSFYSVNPSSASPLFFFIGMVMN